jgi:RNA recognition motif-containing protein
VLFKDVEDAKKAREALNLSVFAGRRILVHFARDNRNTATATREIKEPTSTLFIGNLHYDLSDTELNELFRPLKNIRDVRVSIDRRTGQPRGFAHADFLDVNSAKVAFEQLNGRDIKGRVLRCDYGFGARKYSENTAKKGSQTAAPAAADEHKLDTRPEGSQQPPEKLEDQPEKDQEKEFEQPGDHPEEQLKEEIEKTPEDQAEDKSKQ